MTGSLAAAPAGVAANVAAAPVTSTAPASRAVKRVRRIGDILSSVRG
jgi:hypothetical protein